VQPVKTAKTHEAQPASWASCFLSCSAQKLEKPTDVGRVASGRPASPGIVTDCQYMKCRLSLSTSGGESGAWRFLSGGIHPGQRSVDRGKKTEVHADAPPALKQCFLAVATGIG
jgi:hypothetical protein